MLDLKPLSQQVSEHFRELGEIEALALTSYGLDVSYLERFILPSFFPRLGEGPASAPFLPVFEYLEEHPSLPISVLYDADNLVQRERSIGPGSTVEKMLRWQAHPTRGSKGGVFHPKLILALLRDDDGTRSIVLGCASANLTRPGWGLNLEASALETRRLGEDSLTPLHADLVGRVEGLISHAPDSVALQRIREALRVHHDPSRRWKRKRERSYRMRLWYPGTDQSLWQWLNANVLRGDLSSVDDWQLEVLSPYLSQDVPGLLLQASQSIGKSVRCFLPEDGENYALERDVLDSWDQAIAPEWSRLPGDVLRSRLKDEGGNPKRRLMHAKVYRFWRQTSEVLVVGSANATVQGHLEGGEGNDEACLVFSRESVPERPFQAWLKPLEEAPDPTRCQEQGAKSEDLPPNERCPLIRCVFDWEKDVLAVDNREQASTVDVHIGSEVFSLEPDGALDKRNDEAIRSAFYRSPTARVSYAERAERQWLYLIEEKGLRSKPPAPIYERDADSLIQEWLMTAEDRLAHRMAEVARQEAEDARGQGPDTNITADSDRLNDLFLAVHRFRTSAEAVLQDAADTLELDRLHNRLFGEGVTSIRYFTKKLREAASPGTEGLPAHFDAVNHYVALLTLLDAVERLRSVVSKQGWMNEANSLITDLRAELRSAGETLQREIQATPGVQVDAARLLEWVENSFRYQGEPA